MQMQELLELVRATGARVYAQPAVSSAPGLSVVRVSIVTEKDGVSEVDDKKILLEVIDGVENATWFGGKPKALTPAGVVEAKLEANEDEIKQIVRQKIVADSQKMVTINYQYAMGVAMVNTNVVAADGTVFPRDFVVYKAGGTLNLAERKP